MTIFGGGMQKSVKLVGLSGSNTQLKMYHFFVNHLKRVCKVSFICLIITSNGSRQFGQMLMYADPLPANLISIVSREFTAMFSWICALTQDYTRSYKDLGSFMNAMSVIEDLNIYLNITYE